MRSLCALGLLAAAARAGTKKLPSVLERMRAIDAWINEGAPPPKHWAVQSPKALKTEPVMLVISGQKEVNATSVKVGGKLVKVVVKAQKMHYPATRSPSRKRVYVETKAKGHVNSERAAAIVFLEILYLESLRGKPGVPELHGGWRTTGGVAWVVQDAGPTIGKGKGNLGSLSAITQKRAAARDVSRLC